MRRALRAAFVVGLLLGAGPASAEVVVNFVAPERYTDAENRSASGLTLRVTLGEMRRLFTELGNRVLKPGQSLTIDVLDIDLAGMDQPGAVPYGLRVVTDLTPPRLRLRYRLRQNGRVVASAEESLSDLNFLMRYGRGASGTTFYYERELIRDWLQRRIVLGRPPSG